MTTEKQQLETELTASQQIGVQKYYEELERVSEEVKTFDGTRYRVRVQNRHDSEKDQQTHWGFLLLTVA